MTSSELSRRTVVKFDDSKAFNVVDNRADSRIVALYVALSGSGNSVALRNRRRYTFHLVSHNSNDSVFIEIVFGWLVVLAESLVMRSLRSH